MSKVSKFVDNTLDLWGDLEGRHQTFLGGVYECFRVVEVRFQGVVGTVDLRDLWTERRVLLGNAFQFR